jgi:short-subunit dehydrogenase
MLIKYFELYPTAKNTMKETRSYNNSERVAVVTGSSKGIGKATAIEFANARYSVVINARDETELKQAAEDISKFIKVKDIPYQVTYHKNKFTYR